MTIQTTGPNGILYKLVERALIEAHRNDLVKFNIVNTEKLKQEFRDALKKDYDIKDIDESDILFCFEEVDQNEVEKPVDDKKEDDGEVVDQDNDSEDKEDKEEPKDDSEVSEEPEDDSTSDDTEDQTDDSDTDSSENDDAEGDDDSQEDDSEPSFGITGGEEDNDDDSNEEDDSQDNKDDDEDETVKAVKEAIMKEEEEEEQEDTEEKDQGDEIENATDKDNEDAQGTTMGSSKTKENVVKAVARALYIDNPDDIQMFDINYQNKRCFFIKANIRK